MELFITVKSYIYAVQSDIFWLTIMGMFAIIFALFIKVKNQRKRSQTCADTLNYCSPQLMLLLPAAAAADNATRLTLDRAIALAIEQNPDLNPRASALQAPSTAKRPQAQTFCPRPAPPTPMPASMSRRG